MTDEDRIAERLKGNNCLIKFKDGEELLLHIPQLLGDDEEIANWFIQVEEYLNNHGKENFFPVAGFAMAGNVIKYVRKI